MMQRLAEALFRKAHQVTTLSVDTDLTDQKTKQEYERRVRDLERLAFLASVARIQESNRRTYP